MADVIGQISAPYKCFYKLWHRHRDVVICCHAFTFSSEKRCFFPVNSFHWAPDFLLTNIDWAVSDFLLGYAPPTDNHTPLPSFCLFAMPQSIALTLVFSLEGVFDCVWVCSCGKGICLKMKNLEKKQRKKQRNGFYMHMYVFICRCSGAPGTQTPVILLLWSRLYK